MNILDEEKKSEIQLIYKLMDDTEAEIADLCSDLITEYERRQIEICCKRYNSLVRQLIELRCSPIENEKGWVKPSIKEMSERVLFLRYDKIQRVALTDDNAQYLFSMS